MPAVPSQDFTDDEEVEAQHDAEGAGPSAAAAAPVARDVAATRTVNIW